MSEKPAENPGTCEACGTAPATIHVRKVASGEEVELHLCQDCAKERGVEAQSKHPEGLSLDPVALMIQSIEDVEGTGPCPGCGMTFSRFRETGRLGCARCYQAFSGELTPLLRRVHGAVRHKGKVPVREGADYEAGARLRRLNEDLQRAIEDENYERAAEIRDLIQTLETSSQET